MRLKIIYFFISLAIIDLIILNYAFFVNNPLKKTIVPTLQVVPIASDSSALASRVSQLESTITALQSITPAATLSSPKTALPTASRHLTYLPISGSFNQLAYDWVDDPTSDFYFDTIDYPGLISVTFEASMKLFNGNGLAFTRLFDVTHQVAVPGSQIQTGNQADTIVTSGPLNFMAGHNLIRVQIKSLTADTTYFNSGRLIIVSKF